MEVVCFVVSGLFRVPGGVAVWVGVPGEEEGGVGVGSQERSTPDVFEGGGGAALIGGGDEDELALGADGGLDGVEQGS